MRIHGSYDPIVFQTERKMRGPNKQTRKCVMSDRISDILRLMAEEANERTTVRDYVSKLYDVSLEVNIRVAEIMKGIRDGERERKAKEGG